MGVAEAAEAGADAVGAAVLAATLGWVRDLQGLPVIELFSLILQKVKTLPIYLEVKISIIIVLMYND